MSWFIIPVKNMHDAKSRLGHVLSPPDRKSLALSMLDHVLKTLGESPDCTGVLVVSLDPDVHAMVRSRDMRLLASPDDRSLNAAVSAGCALLAQEGVRRAAILHADLPSLTPGDVQAIARSDGAEVVLGPCRHRTGTNAISVPLPVPFSFAFGPDSFAVHQRRVRSAGLRLRILDRPGVAQDLDRPDDLDLVDGHGNTGAQGSRLAPSQAMFLEHERAEDLASLAVKVTCRGFGRMVTYSPKVFLPLTRLCRDVCHYCTFALRPSQVAAPYMSIDEVLSIARQGEALGCTEALFTLGERPELRYQAARSALKALGHDSTIGYLRQAAEAVLAETTLLPHLNPGCMTLDEMKVLRPVAASMGLMLESGARRLCDRGGPHFGSPDKDPALRWQTIRNAGLLGVPFTTGLLVGIGETRAERIRDLLAIRDLHDEFGHIQEVIIQNFRAKPGTMMAKTPDAPMEELLWTISAARIILGDAISIQAPPNLSLGDEGLLIGAGINDFGGVSPLTADFVNPEAPWPHLDALRARTNAAQRHLGERLTIYPAYASDPGRWADPALHHPIRRLADAEGFAISERWRPGSGMAVSGADADRRCAVAGV